VSRRSAVATTGPRRWQHPARAVLPAMLGLVALGTALLSLPWATQGPGRAPFSVALFTSTSAACVTGLTVVDTGTYWSGFGQGVLLVLMELGGLGLMSAAALLGIVVAGRLGLRSRLLAHNETRLSLGAVRVVVLRTVAVALVVQAVLAAGLVLRLWLSGRAPFGAALWHGVFHSVSAYNNAGFALWPDNLVSFATDPFVLAPVTVAFVVGGLGYPVLLDLMGSAPRGWTLHTRLTLAGTAVLLVAGVVVVTALEWANPATLGALDVPGRLLSGAFSGVAPRTAGFNTIDYAQADALTLLFTDVLMLVGGGSAGTAGGLKVTTVAVLVFAVVAEMRGDEDVVVLHRRIASSTVRQALAVAALAFALITTATALLLQLTDENLDVVLFEVVSAFSTVGLSANLTASLPEPARAVLVVLMIAGRVGPMAAATALALRRSRRAYRYPQARPLVG